MVPEFMKQLKTYEDLLNNNLKTLIQKIPKLQTESKEEDIKTCLIL